jgi:hypothetical protein
MTWRASRSMCGVAVRDQLDRLAWHFGWSLTQLVEELPVMSLDNF